VEPLSPARYQVRFTASTELREKLERLRALMRSSVPDGDLARIIDIAVTEKLQRLEAKRFGQTKAPRGDLAETDTTPSSRHIPAAVRRVVYERDGGRCAFRDKGGRRCERRHDLEFHHKHPFARGGDHSPANVTLMCGVHNTLLAEQDYGEDAMARFRAAKARTSVPVNACGVRIAVRPRWLSSG
jgi:5-methylcytosine-specific restriction endonuclease McrA